mgnify:FL=1
MTSVYYCATCQWSGERPSFTDVSVEVETYISDENGGGRGTKIDRTHRPICPVCFSNVTNATVARELDATLVDIARGL